METGTSSSDGKYFLAKKSARVSDSKLNTLGQTKKGSMYPRASKNEVLGFYYEIYFRDGFSGDMVGQKHFPRIDVPITQAKHFKENISSVYGVGYIKLNENLVDWDYYNI